MEHAGVLGTVTISDQRSYIKIETLHGINPTELHSALNEVCGEFTVDPSMVSHRANCFCGGCVSIQNDRRPKRPRTSNRWKQCEAFEEGRRATCVELSRAMSVLATSVFHNLTNHLKKRKISVWWVPHYLTAEQKQKYLDNCNLVERQIRRWREALLHRIVTIGNSN